MARLFTSGFEWSDAAADFWGGASAPASASAARSGSYGWRCPGAVQSESVIFNHTGTDARRYWLRVYLRKSGNPSTKSHIIGVACPTASGVRVNLDTDGTLILGQGQGVSGGTDYGTSSALSNDTWYRIELAWDLTGAGTNDDYAELWVDGVSVASTNTGAIATGPHTQFRIGTRDTISGGGNGVNLDFDDFALNDETGASQTSLPGEGKVVLCSPISQNQRGSWTGGAGGTGDLTTTIDNKPPIGTASETDLTQMESNDSSGDNATDEYRSNLTTYTDAGIGASDTITLIQPIVNHGEDVATGAKTGSFGMQSNPADTYATFDFGDNVGALGTWSLNWRVASGTITHAPSVTLGSSPVVAVRKTDTGTRVASVDALGLYVEYVVSAVALPPPPTVMQFAVTRSYSY